MPFDWNTYKDLAETLRASDDEASKRSAISRVYYAVFNQAKLFLENDGFQISQNKDNHRQIWDEFVRRGKIFRFIGNKGDRLRKQRNNADYEQEIFQLENEVDSAFQSANQILADLYKIQPKNEN